MTPFDRKTLAALGLGTWQLELAADRTEAIRAVREALDVGLTHLDTAEMYGGGDVEVIVGEAIAGRRDEVFLVSKVVPTHATRRGTRLSCERSLRRLGTDHLDCYLLHWREPTVPLEETFAAFEELREDGLIRSWGVSNFDEGDIEQAVGIAGRGVIACNQVLYNLTQRHVEATVLPWCRNYGIPIVAYSPFDHGRFPSADSPGGKLLRHLARVHDVSAHAIALAFLTRFDDVFAVPKASTVSHVDDLGQALDLELTREELAAIDAAFPVEVEEQLPVL